MSELKDERRLKQERIALLEQKIKLQEGLPFLHGWKFYTWAREFFESTNKDNFLVAANQISKSSTQIRKCIHWATAQELWPTLWRNRPLQFWYLYPTKEVATIEFEKKWVPEFLPRGEFKDDPIYGWRREYKNKNIWAIHFNSGVSVYFKTYAQDVQHLQSGSVHAIFCDEELDEHLYDELNFRRQATDGYFHLVFTATLGQELWRATLEEKGKDEKFPGAFKLQVSMYDCLLYEDGSNSHWTPERIQRAINSCKSQTEVQRRVFGKFVVDSGRKYQGFNRMENMRPGHPLPSTWQTYAGVDIGSGGEKGHPAAIVFVAVNPEHTEGRVIKAWRGDGIETTASDVLVKFFEMRGSLKLAGQFYDWQCKDFFVIASRMGEPFTPADKSHERGEQILNVLFGNKMLHLYEGDPEIQKLANELASLQKNTPKNKAKDDLTDALRYAVTLIPWNFAVGINGDVPLGPGPVTQKDIDQEQLARRRGDVVDPWEQLGFFMEQEMDAWNELYEP